MSNSASSAKRRVVIVGGGFGGLEAAKRLKRADVDITLIDRNNYHLFQPLLYQVATGGLSPANIAAPLRSVLRKQKNCRVLLGEVTGFDIAEDGAGGRVLLANGDEAPFDDLLVAAGATGTYFGNDHWEEVAPGLKTIGDATRIRRNVYRAFEAAEREPDPEVRKAWMTFVVVGGGPTGVELAGALSEIANNTLRDDFRRIQPADARVILVESGEHVLDFYPEELCACAEKKLAKLKVELINHSRVTDISPTAATVKTSQGEQAHASEQTIPTRTILWAAGVRASPLAGLLAEACGVEPAAGGRVPVNATLNVANHACVFAIGDMTSCTDADGQLMPGLAPVAMQQGMYVAKSIIAKAGGKALDEPFRYKDRGTMATIGRAAAVALIGERKFCGLFAWLLWLFVHLLLIVQFQNRLLILVQWAWNYVTFNRSARLIIDEPEEQQVFDRQPSA